ncbi:MAG: 2-hydroxychromene-2-carboxylate isomerase [Rhodospirillales bacterium]|nr:2-hydroxychromene-2-carboxylate isomerase [Rhodospirillales bacterium]
MPAEIDFYFDFSSPYGYLASARIEDIAKRHNRTVHWRPFLLGVAFKITGAPLLAETPIKGDYAKRDFARTARLFGVPFKMPEQFPFAPIAASRAVYWLADRDPNLVGRFVKAAYHAAFGEGRNITAAESVADIVARLGIDRMEVMSALVDPQVKDRLRVEVDDAIKKGAFGSPYIIVDGEPFWGCDRLEQVDRWLTSGGW